MSAHRRRRALSRELLRGVFSLLLAFVLWYSVADEEEAQIVASLPLELLNVPEGLEVVNQSLQEVDVRLRGPSDLLRDAPLIGVHARLDLAEEGPGERTWFLGTEDVDAPPAIQVVRVDPTEVLVRLDRTTTAEVRVSPRVLGQPATGFEIHRVVIEPPELVVGGPESLLRDLLQVTTEPISAQGLRETYSRRLQVQVDPALRPRTRMVDVRLEIGEEREARDLRLTTRLAPPAEGDPSCELLLGVVEAVVRVPTSMLTQVTEETLFVEVSCAGFAEGFHEAVPRLLYPPDPEAPLGTVSFEPPTVPVAVGPAPDLAATPSRGAEGES